jgi:hypothetical protein
MTLKLVALMILFSFLAPGGTTASNRNAAEFRDTRFLLPRLAGRGAAEIVTPGVDALGHVPGHFEGLAARITELAASRELRARVGRAARLSAERSFDRGRLARDLVPIYQAVLRD